MDRIAKQVVLSTLAGLRHLVSLLFLVYHLKKKKRLAQNRSPPRFWVRPIYIERPRQGDFRNLIKELINDQEAFKRYFRMSHQQFNTIHASLAHLIRKKNTRMRKSITSRERLAITLRYLASGDLQSSISFAFRVSQTSVSRIVKETCAAIWTAMQPTYLPKPSKETLQQISSDFLEMWNLPNCIGAVDGKHVVIQCPSNSGSKYFNYKQSFSVVLMAMCNAKYMFTYVDIGSYGSQSDGGIFHECSLGKQMEAGTFPLPDPKCLPGTVIPLPHYAAGDGAFPLRHFLMRPFPGKNLPLDKRIFNYRLCRLRRVIENCFGILAARWRIFRRPQNTNVETVVEVVKATVCLHNFLMSNSSKSYCPSTFVDAEGVDGEIIEGQWHSLTITDNGLLPFELCTLNSRSAAGTYVRDMLKEYVNSIGAVPWQEKAVYAN